MDDLWHKFHHAVRLNSLALELNQVISNSPKHQTVDIRWIPPPDGWFKVNSNGSVIANRKATYGGRDRSNRPVFG